ncbi:MAG: DUF6153 family protein [Mycobacterium sp.]
MTQRYVRWRLLGVLVLIVGVIGMHSLVIAPGHTLHAERAAVHATAHQVQLGDACDCNGHNAFHACVFVMTDLLVLAALALLCWIGATADMRTPSRIREVLRRRQRAPPWTVLTLAEMSLLRI